MRLDNGDFRNMYERSKKRGKDKKHVDKFSTISGDLEKASVQRMWDAFPAIPAKGRNGEMNGRTGRFFRYLQQTKDGKLISTLKNIGKNVCQKVGKKVAAFLDLTYPEVSNSINICVIISVLKLELLAIHRTMLAMYCMHFHG